MWNFHFETRQLAGAGEVFFDHCAWMVADMAHAAAVSERLGFPLTPFSVHGNRDARTGAHTPQGTANRLMMLETGYVELLTDVKEIDNPLTQNFRAALARYEGVHLLAFGIDDAVAAYARIEAAGIPLQPMVNLRREVEAENGSSAEVAFSVIRTGFDAFPEGRMQLLKHLTPEHMWQRRYMPKENGIAGLLGAVVCVDDPAESAGRIGRLLDITPEISDGAARIACARGGVIFVMQDRLSEYVPDARPLSLPYIAAIGMVAPDLGKTRNFLEGRGVRLIEDAGRIVIPAAEALGTAISVHQL